MAENVENTVELKPGETEDQRLAELIVSPNTRAAFLHYHMARRLFGPREGKADQRASFDGMVAEIEKQQALAGAGDLTRATDLLVTQAHVLDALFGEFTTRALDNAASYPDAMQRFMGLALKAQAQSRTAIEALARIHQPREQVVRHIHVNEGGQAIVADQLTIGGPGGGSAAIADQSHAKGSSGAALPRPNPLRNGVPIPSGSRSEALPHARGDKPRRPVRQQQRAEARASNSGDGPAQGIDE